MQLPDLTGIVRLQLEHGADVNARNTVGRTPLKLATIYGRGETAALLRRHGAEE